MTTTKKPAGDIRIDIANLNADLDTIKIAFNMMMNTNNNAMSLNATSPERHDLINLRSNRQVWAIEYIDFMIGRLQDIKESVESLWD
jgi:hypothetical protein